MAPERLEFITFLLAMLGYAGLTATVLWSARGRLPVGFWRAVALIIVVHVAMVWTVRYGGSFAQATRNGYAGFLMFHAALTMIVASVFVEDGRALWLIRIAFAVVTMGALGAVFIYDVVALYRIPVIVCAVAGTAGMARMMWRARSARLRAT